MIIPQAKDTTRWYTKILVHKFIPMPQAMKIPDAKAAMEKEWNMLEAIPAWYLDKMKSKMKGILEAQRETKRKSTLVHSWTSVISNIQSLNQNF